MSQGFPDSIHVARIPESGLDLRFELGEEWFARWREEDPGLEFAGPGRLTVRLQVTKHGHDVLLRGHLEGELPLSCSRCLAAFSHPVTVDFDLLLSPGPEPVGEEEEELSAADLDVDFYTGDMVEVERFLREQVLLALPLKPLCAETCRGLCPRCGADLNQEPCQCPAEDSASPWAALKKFKA